MKKGKKQSKPFKLSYGYAIGILVVALILVVVIGFCCDDTGYIKRSFDKHRVSPGEVVEVSLDIVLGEDQTYYLFEDAVPEGFVLLGNISRDNKVRVADIQDAKSNVYSYKVQAPMEAGTYVFFGEYGMKGVSGTLPIKGEDTIVVK